MMMKIQLGLTDGSFGATSESSAKASFSPSTRGSLRSESNAKGDAGQAAIYKKRSSLRDALQDKQMDKYGTYNMHDILKKKTTKSYNTLNNINIQVGSNSSETISVTTTGSVVGSAGGNDNIIVKTDGNKIFAGTGADTISVAGGVGNNSIFLGDDKDSDNVIFDGKKEDYTIDYDSEKGVATVTHNKTGVSNTVYNMKDNDTINFSGTLIETGEGGGSMPVVNIKTDGQNYETTGEATQYNVYGNNNMVYTHTGDTVSLDANADGNIIKTEEQFTLKLSGKESDYSFSYDKDNDLLTITDNTTGTKNHIVYGTSNSVIEFADNKVELGALKDALMTGGGESYDANVSENDGEYSSSGNSSILVTGNNNGIYTQEGDTVTLDSKADGNFIKTEQDFTLNLSGNKDNYELSYDKDSDTLTIVDNTTGTKNHIVYGTESSKINFVDGQLSLADAKAA